MHCVVTGAAGFIGFHLARRLLADGHRVTGIDGLTDYYDVGLKRARLRALEGPGFANHVGLLEEPGFFARVMDQARPDILVHLAAQAGVRYSLENPASYVAANVVGTFEVLEGLRAHPVRHALLASTSSVYGGNDRVPFRETDPVARPVSLYAASKVAGESMAHAYAHLWRIPTTAFRFFTVYGPWGRPDMAVFVFTKRILAGEPVEVFDHGRAARDFTYIDDLIESIVRLIDRPPGGAPVSESDSLSPVAPFRVVNIGGGNPATVSDLLDGLEAALGRRATRLLRDLPPGDVPLTQAETGLLRDLIGYAPATPLREGVAAFVDWYRAYHANGPDADAAGLRASRRVDTSE
ncbi:NAD-dependent epimerase/dehydratase [Methylobacterium sp. 4-46]|uniref:NAD-dependent epimerase/dehydratase family protein n=1 Tax=unclassified Methylobacterium TaxID=2615210 RepID=UPI000152C214|nr:MULTISPECIES: NAD-dependent epimerase/dehydratase family protein [Methylobacterium]ACA17617.1 NAD-dependent epimerase/dehydratase [Methylobacterium sp. 4-46]WFT83291.1 NAD-dependent epimerase/dehydratase family protein [Methylobacterium nodulans]